MSVECIYKPETLDNWIVILRKFYHS